jgi:hypothetical protein
MDPNTVILILVVSFILIFILMFTYYEYFKQEKCNLLNVTNCKKLMAGLEINVPILQKETHLETQFDNEPYSLYRDYFDQNSPWIGTSAAHRSENVTESDNL